MQLSYPAKISKDESDRFFVEFRDMPDTFTEGETLEEAQFNAVEALSGMLAWHIEAGNEIPASSKRAAGEYMIAPDAKTQAALLLRQARAERPLADIARSLQTSWLQVQRLENPRYWPSLKSLDRAAAAMGKRLVLQMV